MTADNIRCQNETMLRLKVFLVGALLSLPLGGDAGAEPVVLGYSAVTSVFLPFWIGKEMGFYKKEGLDAQLVYIASSTTMAQAMFARQVAISTVNSGSVVTSTLQGGDLVLMGAIMNAASFYIISRPEIASVQDLRGKKIGVTRLGSSSDFAIREYLQKNKLNPNRDVTIVQVGGMPELAAALNNGSISAAPLSAPSSHIAEQKGNRIIANLANEGIYFVIAGMTTTRRFLKEQRGDAKAFLRAFGRATQFMHQQKDEAKKYLTKFAKIDDPGMLEGSMKYAYDFTEKIPLVKREGVQVVLDQEAVKNPQAREFTVERFYDNSLVQELINEGFYKSLWGK
ncbi:MAG: ABC transporter substrate-binding protein [Deltaproteobacteria bacterium]|nr:ABC transporter substrate-binding protein [Deltaproteobacteria bacterium]